MVVCKNGRVGTRHAAEVAVKDWAKAPPAAATVDSGVGWCGGDEEPLRCGDESRTDGRHGASVAARVFKAAPTSACNEMCGGER